MTVRTIARFSGLAETINVLLRGSTEIARASRPPAALPDGAPEVTMEPGR
jgi:hypothetical protein